MKQYELVDGSAVRQLREIYKLDRPKAAKLSRLSESQLQDLEEGSLKAFSTPALKVQGALQLARALSGQRDNGLPYANVIKGPSAPKPSPGDLSFPTLHPVKYQYRTNPKDLILVAAIFTFVFLAVSIPVMTATHHVRQRGDILIPRTWKP
jgi:hypothetical protein